MKNTKHSILGFLCSLFLFIFLLFGAFVTTLRIGIFDGNGAINTSANLVLSDSIKNTISKNSNEILSQYGFSFDSFNELMNDDYVNTVIDAAGNAILSEKEIDLSSIKTDTVDFCNNTATLIVDEFVDNLEKSDGDIDKTTISDNPIIQAFSRNYNLDIEEEMKSKITEKYPNVDVDSNLDLSKINTDELRVTLNSAVEKKLYPRLDELTDKLIHKAEEELTKVSNKIQDNPTYKRYDNLINLISSNMTLLILFLGMCIIFFFLIQFMLYCGIYKNRPFIHLGIVSLLACVPMLLIGYSNKIFENFMNTFINKINTTYTIAEDVIKEILIACLKPFIITGFVLIAISIIAFIVSVILSSDKKKALS